MRPFINDLVDAGDQFDWLQIASAAHQIKVEKQERELVKKQANQKAKKELGSDKQVRQFSHFCTCLAINTERKIVLPSNHT